MQLALQAGAGVGWTGVALFEGRRNCCLGGGAAADDEGGAAASGKELPLASGMRAYSNSELNALRQSARRAGRTASSRRKRVNLPKEINSTV
jgi:hypothetical protein